MSWEGTRCNSELQARHWLGGLFRPRNNCRDWPNTFSHTLTSSYGRETCSVLCYLLYVQVDVFLLGYCVEFEAFLAQPNSFGPSAAARRMHVRLLVSDIDGSASSLVHYHDHSVAVKAQ
jgi:hypothetical protein